MPQVAKTRTVKTMTFEQFKRIVMPELFKHYGRSRRDDWAKALEAYVDDHDVLYQDDAHYIDGTVASVKVELVSRSIRVALGFRKLSRPDAPWGKKCGVVRYQFMPPQTSEDAIRSECKRWAANREAMSTCQVH